MVFKRLDIFKVVSLGAYKREIKKDVGHSSRKNQKCRWLSGVGLVEGTGWVK